MSRTGICNGKFNNGITDGLVACSKLSGCGYDNCPSDDQRPGGPGDLKAARNASERATGTERPRLSLQQYNAAVWKSRATDYGASKYSRGNFHGAPPAGVQPVAQIVEYLDAAFRHLGKVAQAVNVAYGTGGDVAAALACVDDESSAGFPPSMLPHLAHVLSGLSIAIEIGVQNGILPADPGQPWKTHPMYAEVLARRGEAPVALPQKNDPDTERARSVRRELCVGYMWRDLEGGVYEVVHAADVGYRPRWWLLPGANADSVGLHRRTDLHTDGNDCSSLLALVEKPGACDGTTRAVTAGGRATVPCTRSSGCCLPGCPARRDTMVPPTSHTKEKP